MGNVAHASPLQTCEHCDALIDITEQEPLAEVGCPSCGATLTVRGFIGHFELEQVAGRGGMGVVYKALDTSLDRHVALKLLRKDHSDNATLIEQLATEAAITASINHPHVVKVFSSGTERGRFYLAMELVSRGSLDDLIRLQGRVAEAQVLEVGIQIAQGLRAAQQHGLIHRDVKPGNILFADNHTAKIVDFGLAIFMDEEESVRGEIWGTPYYVAPEKLDNKPEDFRSDIYSLGGTLFHAIAGRPPFEAESASMVALKHLKSQPMSLQAYAPHVSGSTAYVINRTLHKDPDERYQSYDELIEHLEYARAELLENAGRVQQKRVVLEGTDDQKAWGWVTFGMIVVMLGLGAVGWSMRNKATSSMSPPPPETASRAQPTDSSVFQNARAKLSASKPTEAAEAFRQLGSGSKLAAADLAWATFQEGLAELAAGNLPAAHTAFAQLPAKATAIQNDAALVAFLTTAADQLKEASEIPSATAKGLNRENYESLALLAFGLHNWHLGKHEPGVALLRQFRSASPSGNDAWIVRLKPFADAVVEEFTQFEMKARAVASAASPEAVVAAAAELRAIKGTLASRAEAVLASHQGNVDAATKDMEAAPPNGLYKIVNRKSGKALSVEGASNDDGAQLVQQDYAGKLSQQWVLQRSPLGFLFVSAESGKSIDLSMSGADNGTKIQQWTSNETEAQRWHLRSAGDGAFKIVNVSSFKLVGVHGGNDENGASVVQWEDTGAADQSWVFEALKSEPVGDWTPTDIGNPTLPGTFTGDKGSGKFTVVAGGADISGNADSFFFVQRAITGDFQLTAKLESVSEADTWTKAGIMVRADLTPGSPHVFLGTAPGQGLVNEIRPELKADTLVETIAEIRPPCSLRITRKGETCVLEQSRDDGQVWTPVVTRTISLPATVHVGIAAAAHTESQLTTVRVSGLKVEVLAP